ncbi:hypothetical protein Ancab_019021 [Ancistrocladus abbreviatus]
MKCFFMLANLFLLVLCLGILQQISWSLVLITFSTSSLFYSLLNFWFVPGGFAWREHSQSSISSSKIRGPIGWPFLGSLPQMGPRAHQNLASLAASMGSKRLMVLSLGSTPLIISSHPETAKDILCSPSFSDRPIKSSTRVLMFERALGFAPSGSYWRHLRRIAANCLFSPRRISSLEALRGRIVMEMVDSVLREMKERGVVEMRGILNKGSLRNMLGSVFGSSLGSQGDDLGLMVKQGYELISAFNLEDYFPFGFLDFLGVKRSCHRLSGKVTQVVSQIIEERKRCEDLSSRNDFLSVLLSLPQQDQLKDADMVAVLWETLFRGTDTIAILLEWIMARMVLHQDIQAKAQEEIDACIGDRRHIRDSDIPNLPYLQAIVKEVLRLHPPGPLLSWARLAIHDVHIDKVLVPAGTTAMVNMWAISHDPSIWEDPWSFMPERFIEKDILIMGSDLRLAPFGSGRRVCPGRALGLTTVQLWLAQLLYEFRWIPGECVNLSEHLRLSLEMKKPLVCHVVLRHHT